MKVAYSGKQALNILEQESFDILFTDLKMAEMGGMVAAAMSIVKGQK